MSKAFALAGARVGYLAAAPEICDALRVVRLPYHLSAVTQAVARAALRHADELLARRRRRCAPSATRPSTGCVRRASRSPTVTRTSCSSARFPDRHAVWQGLLDRGVLIRETGPDGWLRVSIGTAGRDGSIPGGTHRRDASPTEDRPMTRTATLDRQTKESKVHVEVDLDGSGRSDVSTGVGFYDHMLTSFARHALVDLTVTTEGDTHIDAHHTVEDTAIVLGQALREALGDKQGIRRFGDALVPLDEALVQCAVDVSGRPYCVHVGEPDGQAYVVIGGDVGPRTAAR